MRRQYMYLIASFMNHTIVRFTIYMDGLMRIGAFQYNRRLRWNVIIIFIEKNDRMI